jgi:transposase
MDKRHTRQFKEQAVALAKGSEKSVSSIATDLGIHPQTLRYWIDHPPKDKDNKPAVQADSNDPVALRLQLNEAREQIRVLEMEKEILKKATAFFAKENR